MLPASRSFDAVADRYERLRPGYPEALVERVIEFAELDGDSRLLELGSGSGKATLPFARRGLRVLGLEPGVRLAALARASLVPFGDVEIRSTTFEAWPIEERSFDLVFAGQSYHWLAKDGRLERCARALKPSGALAVFGHAPDVSGYPAYRQLQAAYRRYAPSIGDRDAARHFYAATASPMLAELAGSPLFGDVRHEIFAWHETLSAAEYCELCSTYSDHALLPDDQRTQLLEAVRRVLDEHGGTITVEYRTGLFLARAR